MPISRVYLDHNSTSPLRPEARAAMLACLDDLSGGWANPSSPHAFGHAARLALEDARREVADLLGCDAPEIVFVSGGSEADNLAVRGAAAAWRAAQGAPGRLVASCVEHPAVLETCRRLTADGWRLTLLPVDRDGVVDPAVVERELTADTALLSVMAANNETGVLQPIDEIGRVARRAGVPFHVDAVQSAGRLPRAGLGDGALPDYVSISSHKLGGPPGIGALRVREGAPLSSRITGGGQESRRRAGTQPVALAAGFAAAARTARVSLEREAARIGGLRDRLEEEVLRGIDGARINGAGARRLHNTTSLTIPGAANEPLVIRLDLEGFAVSTGSACSTGAARPSHVLAAMGLPADAIGATIRISLGHTTAAGDVDGLVAALRAAAVPAGAIRCA